MARPIALQQISAIDLEAPDLVDLAAEVGCDGVCVFTCQPEGMPMRFPRVSRGNLAAFRARLAGTGLSVAGAEHFPVAESVDIGAYAEGLEIAAELGAQRACATVYDTDPGRAADTLGALADLAAGFRLRVAIEFTGLSPGCASLARAVSLVDLADRPNLGVCLDPLHLVRTGGTPADVAALAPRYFTSLQVCDGRGLHLSHDYLAECMEREAPGLGDFPLEAIFRAAPATTPVDLEVPTPRRGAERAVFLHDAVSRTRRLLAATER